MEPNFTITPSASKALKNMLEYVSSRHKASVVLINIGKVPGTDVRQCMVSFLYRSNVSDESLIEIDGIPIVIEVDDIYFLEGKSIDYDDGKFLIE